MPLIMLGAKVRLNIESSEKKKKEKKEGKKILFLALLDFKPFLPHLLVLEPFSNLIKLTSFNSDN